MNERIRQKAKELRARQKRGELTTCPRCGRQSMETPLEHNALSRHLNGVYICPSCGMSEAMLVWMKTRMPLHMWAFFKPECPPSGFKSMTAQAVMDAVIEEQVEFLKHTYEQCMKDPERREVYRYDAFENCPGLTELWTEPFCAKYTASDGTVLLRFRTGADGSTEYAADIVGR